eukprot:234270_1
MIPENNVPNTQNNSLNSIQIYDCIFENNYNFNTIITSNNNDILTNIYKTYFDNHCADSCLLFTDSNLRIDRFSCENQVALTFGHQINNVQTIKNNTLYLVDFDAFNININIAYLNFGSKNGSIIFEPYYEEFDTTFHSQLLFDNKSALVNPTNEYFIGELIDKTLICDNTNDICYISCHDVASCTSSHIYLHAKNIALIKCTAAVSCSNAYMKISSTNKAIVLCNEPNACSDSIITISHVEHITVECSGIYSCKGSQIRIENSADVTIICYNKNACEDIVINSTSNDIILKFYNFNANVQIYLPTNFKKNNLQCVGDAYLKLNGKEYNGSLKDNVYDLFGSDPPCADVTFYYSLSKPAKCEIKYIYRLDLENYLQNVIKSFMESFPKIYVSDITNITCIGTAAPTIDPTIEPTVNPTNDPSAQPTTNPTFNPTTNPTND